MYGKIIDGKLVIAGNIIKGKNWSITNPTEEQLIEKGYIRVYYQPKPKFDVENEKLVEEYIQEEDIQINVLWNKVKLTDEEHNNIVLQKITEIESEMTARYIRNASLGDEYAIEKMQDIENRIAAERTKLK